MKDRGGRIAAGERADDAAEPVSRFIPVAVSKPALAAALGIDGGAIFQILAVENFGLPPAAIGAAFGLGLLSLPLQVWAARMPLRYARRNLQAYLVLAAIQCVVLAWLVAVGATGGLAATALVVTVTAEVAISVLFATAWQPLLSTRTRSRDRQRINAGWTALGKGILAGLLVVFSAVEDVGRTLLLLALAVVAVGVAVNLGRIAEAPYTDRPGPPSSPRQRLPASIWWILVSFAAINVGALPLWLVYLSEVLWPTANLGVVAALQTAANVAALLAWRTAQENLGRRAMAGTVLVLAGSLALAGIGTVADNTAKQVTVLVVTVAMTFGMSYASLALLEMAHRLVAERQGVVRVFTLIDVVDSSSLQLGLFLGGLLTTLAAHTLSWAYVAFVVSMSALAALAVARTAWLTRDR